MTAKTTAPRTCDECRYDGGIHYSVPQDGGEIVSSRCPNWYAVEAQATAQKLAADAHTEAFRAAKQIITEAAEQLPEFSANTIRERVEAAQIPGPVVGAAFSWARREGLIEPAGRRVMSSESTTRHRIDVWASRIYQPGRATA